MGEYTIRDNPIVKGLLIGVILFISGVGSPCVQGLSESTINLPEDQIRVKQVYLNHEPILSHRIKEIESHYLLLNSWSFLSKKDDGRLRLGQLHIY